jgi:hypothetical protein
LPVALAANTICLVERPGRQHRVTVVVSFALAIALGAPSPRALAQPAAPAADFGPQARLLWRAVACGGSDALPRHLPAKTIDAHCKAMTWVYGRFHKKWVSVAAPFFQALRPAGLPPRVLYPFGGGDLLFALVVYPDATEITSVSLERAGNVRVVDTIGKADFVAGLADATFMIKRLAGVEYSFTEHMGAMQQAALPVQVAMALAALAAHGYEPVSLRYFAIADDGTLRYLTLAELDAGTPKKKARKKPAPAASPAAEGAPAPADAHDPNNDGDVGKPVSDGGGIPAVYGNVEITFRKLGDPSAPLRTYRSIAGNLHDSKLDRGKGLGRYLAAQAPFSAMIKAASYLIWRDDFSTIRDVLLAGMVFMVSDSTGILPRHSQAAGFTLTAYGDFKGSMLGTKHELNKDMIALWKAQPRRPLGFRFGYPDWQKKGGHLLVTAKPQATTQK